MWRRLHPFLQTLLFQTIKGAYYWKQLENKQEMKASRFIKWNNCIIRRLQRLYASNATITKLWLATTNKG
jgi:hypothetical protein